MVRTTPTLIVASLVLLAAGVAAAQSMLAGPSAGLSVHGGSVVAQTTPSTTGTTPSAAGPSTGPVGTTGALGTTGSSTGATGTTAGTTTPNGTSTNGTATTATSGALAIDQVVSITRSVAAGTPVNAFTVPVGQQLVITDVLVTNPGTAPACGAQVSPSGTASATPVAGTATTTARTSEAGTGLLCVPAQTSLNLGLTTGLEFEPGQSVVLTNTISTTETTTPATTLHYHLRGFLMSAS
jgi:hypothetical protein